MKQNTGVASQWYGWNPTTSPSGVQSSLKIESVTEASSMMVMVDWVEEARVNWPLPVNYAIAYSDWFVPNPAGTPASNLKYPDWHGGDSSNDLNAAKGNDYAAFMDGHSENVSFDVDNPYYATNNDSDFWMGGLEKHPNGTDDAYPSGSRDPKF